MPGEAAVAAAVRAHPERLPQAQRHRHPPHPARAHRRGLPHVLGQARRLHQAARRSRRPERRRTAMPYTADKPALPETVDELRARIPGWGADLDPTDRPSVPRERFDPDATGAHWDFPERQPEKWPRERSIEHASCSRRCSAPRCPPKGLSGVDPAATRTDASARARAAHWLLLIAADRVDVAREPRRGRCCTRPARQPDHRDRRPGRAEAPSGGVPPGVPGGSLPPVDGSADHPGALAGDGCGRRGRRPAVTGASSLTAGSLTAGSLLVCAARWCVTVPRAG